MKKNVLDTAYSLYMPQIRAEIEALYDVVETALKPYPTPNILEIGTKYGGTFYIWNLLNPNGLTISIDMDDGGLHGGVGNYNMDKRDLWFLERFPNCDFIRGNSHDPETITRLKAKTDGKFQFIFIDGDHTHDGVKQDFEDYSKFASESAIIAFHDIVDSPRHQKRNVHVAKFWNEIKTNYKHLEIIHPDTENPDELWGGIGVLFL